MRWFKALLGVAAAVLMSSSAAAQTTTGTITGRIVDGQGLSVPGVTVDGHRSQSSGHPDRGLDRQRRLHPPLPPGTYTVTFELSGFERQTKPIALAPTQTLTLNVAIGPATLTETVDVVGDGRRADADGRGRHQLQAGA